MADGKLLTELCRALVKGIETTKRKQLDDMFKDFDTEFPQQAGLDQQLSDAMATLASWTQIHNTTLMRAHVAYALLLAIIHTTTPVDQLRPDFPATVTRVQDDRLIANLLTLSEALNSDEPARRLKPFVAACSSRTNVRDQRVTRFQWFCRALTSTNL